MMTRTGLYFSWFLITVTIVEKANIIFGQSIVMRLTDPAGEIMSDGYPNSTSLFQGWNITVTEGYRIHLEFLDFMLNETIDCRLSDLVTLYDGPVGDFNREVGRWCWNNFTKLMPNSFISTSNYFYLIFIGQEGNTRKGFKARYYSINSYVVTTIETTSKFPTADSSSTNPHTTLPPVGVITQGLSTTVIIIVSAGAFIFLVVGLSCVIYLIRRLKRKNEEPVDIPPYYINNQVTSGNTLNQSQDSNTIQLRDESGGTVYEVPSNEGKSDIASDNYDKNIYSRNIHV
ncbi:uncharacterized protein [Apostichopus japonicus]|uniref:uncharacterized protein isoform X2 n=1 Tax=Stichopus japonicus TaxID=307972 RepID=UPI003AB5ABDA